jgi:3-oxoacyl-[acyl-carrier protein] reductase
MEGSMLKGKKAFVTGGSRGIGAAIVKKLAAEGAEVTFTYRSSDAEAQALAAEAGAGTTAVKVDVADAEAVAAAVRNTRGIDILVNNAGVAEMAPIGETPIDLYDRVFNVNVRGLIAVTNEAAKHLPDGGRIVNIGSINGEVVPYQGGGVYAASKGAVRMLTKAWARDLGERGITVNSVQPGPIDTDLNPSEGEFADFLKPFTANKRYGKPEEVAELVAFLAGPGAANITGAAINIDGGSTA